jgi:ABC-type branched-subunit amino acid transport system substrate-binding protein
MAACIGAGGGGWNSQYGEIPTGAPRAMQNDFNYPEYEIYGNPDGMRSYVPAAGAKNVSVLLPLSGPNASLGRGIGAAVEMAFLQRKYENVSVTFYDLSGNKSQKQAVIANALAGEPDIVLGPVFAEDARMIRDMKPESLPVLSFTSDTGAVGNGVMTMALIPLQSVEAIVREISRDNARGLAILAPKTQSGRLMAGAAVSAANIYDVPVSGLFYYAEGDSESIKNAAQQASMFDARAGANTRAREILSDILVKENLTAAQKAALNAQLEKLSKSDTLGKAPYDGILLLGNAADSKTIVSFLR